MTNEKSAVVHRLAIFLVSLSAVGVLVFVGYFVARFAFYHYFDSWGKKLVALERQGLLSRQFGAAWQDILAQDRMQEMANHLAEQLPDTMNRARIVRGVAVKDYPSLSIVSRLNEVRTYTNTIQIVDRRGLPLAQIKTDHTRSRLKEFPPTLIWAIIAAEDRNFYSNKHGYEFNSFLRAATRAVWQSIRKRKQTTPRGTSSITQQVAKLFISSLDESGNRMVSTSIDRKLRELRLAAALRMLYRSDEILEVYLNHCVTSDYGIVGVKDIAQGIFKKNLSELTDAEAVYLSRMIKWGRNVREKIVKQCRIDMPRIGEALSWTPHHQREILAGIHRLTFAKPKQIVSASEFLVDLANEFWLLYCRNTIPDTTGYEEEEMSLINPFSLIRRKGNLKIKLTIDGSLQRTLEQLVNARGYGNDTIIYTDVRIGSTGDDIYRTTLPRDTLRRIRVLRAPERFSEPNTPVHVTLNTGDTLVSNIRYNRIGKKVWHRSCYYYARRPMRVEGQYYAYCIIDARTGVLLAYYSRDKIGSRLACLLRNRIPNGSSTAKPVFNALNFDLGNFMPYDMFNDSLPVTSDVPWKRYIIRNTTGTPISANFVHGGVPGEGGWTVANHGKIFQGCKYIFDQLNASNNILGVETAYRLDRQIFDNSGNPNPEAFPFAQLLFRLNAVERIRDSLKLNTVTGVRLYRELLRVVGVDVDGMNAAGGKTALFDSMYSVALGSLELSLYEQAHVFNMLYNNDLIDHPARHPGLVIDRIDINGTAVFSADQDIIKRYHPFADLNNLRPAYLGMHKRLVSGSQDSLSVFDIPYVPDTTMSASINAAQFTPYAYFISEPLSNYAKSGTTDDIIKPFNADPATSGSNTNYGLWNVTIRLDLNRLAPASDGNAPETVPDIHDVTIACIGECNYRFTGERLGKTLHKFVSTNLLKKAGVPSPHGFFEHYEQYIRRITPDSLRFCGGPQFEERGEMEDGTIGRIE